MVSWPQCVVSIAVLLSLLGSVASKEPSRAPKRPSQSTVMHRCGTVHPPPAVVSPMPTTYLPHVMGIRMTASSIQ